MVAVFKFQQSSSIIIIIIIIIIVSSSIITLVIIIKLLPALYSPTMLQIRNFMRSLFCVVKVLCPIQPYCCC